MPNNGEMINYTYTASGAKISQQLESGDKGGLSTRRDYAGAFVFVNNAPGWVGTPHGRFVYVNDGWQNEFHLRDHLGNTRVVLLEEEGDEYKTLQQNHYYPFGMLIPSLSTTITLGALKDNRYLYNGKEFNDDFDLNWYDYGARFYDAQIARWHSVDPLAEYFYSTTPYNYCFNNPMLFIDPFGMDTVKANTPNPIKKGDVVELEDGTYIPPQGADEVQVYPEESSSTASRRGRDRIKTRPMGWYEIFVVETRGDPDAAEMIYELYPHKNYLPKNPPKNLFEKHDPYDNWVERLRERFRRNQKKSSDQMARESTGDQTNSSGRPVVADKSEKGDSIVVDVAIMFYESDSVLLQKKIIHKSSRKGRYISDPFVSPSNHDFRK